VLADTDGSDDGEQGDDIDPDAPPPQSFDDGYHRERGTAGSNGYPDDVPCTSEGLEMQESPDEETDSGEDEGH